MSTYGAIKREGFTLIMNQFHVLHRAKALSQNLIGGESWLLKEELNFANNHLLYFSAKLRERIMVQNFKSL